MEYDELANYCENIAKEMSGYLYEYPRIDTTYTILNKNFGYTDTIISFTIRREFKK